MIKNVSFFNHFDDLDAESKYLIHKAKEATQFAYAPYSKFEVGASILLDDNTVVIGANQENASFPLCMCAERVALYTVAIQHPQKIIKKLAVVAHKKSHKEFSIAPCCGACCQVILEFEIRQGVPIEIIMLTKGNQWTICNSIAALLPFGFSLKT